MGSLPADWDEFPDPLHPSDVIVTKRQWGAFYGTDLDLQLRRRGVDSIVLGGIATSIGVESTARSASEHGYQLIICEDLCADLSEETHAHSFKHPFPRLARVANSEAWCLTKFTATDALTAYLATSPGGLDSIAIIASSSPQVDLPFVLALQSVRLVCVIGLAPLITRFVVKHSPHLQKRRS